METILWMVGGLIFGSLLGMVFGKWDIKRIKKRQNLEYIKWKNEEKRINK